VGFYPLPKTPATEVIVCEYAMDLEREPVHTVLKWEKFNY